MRYTAVFTFAVLTATTAKFCVPMRAQTEVQRKGTVTLASLRDKSRPVLIFAPKPDDPQLQVQLRTFAEHASGVAERDITVIALPYNNPSPRPATMTSSEAFATRPRFGVAPPDFTVILVGKDGGEKLRSTKPISFEKLRATVDAMPMRQEEMRQQGRTR